MSRNYNISLSMGDLTTTNCRSPFASDPSLISLKSRAALIFKQTTHSYNRSFTTHFKCNRKRTFARPAPHEHSKILVSVNSFGLVTGESLQVEYEEEKVGSNLMQQHINASGVDEANEETQTNAEKSLLHVMASPDDDDKEAFLASLQKVPIFTTERLLQQVSNSDELSLIEYVHRDAADTPSASSEIIIQAQKERMMQKKTTQQLTYLFAALASSVGITSLAGASVYGRFAWQMQGGEVPWTEMCGTFSLALGAAVGMEYWARWAHRTLWHASLWSMHESHHQPRDGPFELNDVFAIINAVPAIALMAFGFLNKGLVPGLCFGAGLGITVFGIAYMFVHDGLVHRRFPVGPIADVPYFQKVAAAHQLHHADKFNGVPYGLFLGPMELEEVGGQTELETLLQKRKREKTNPING